VLGKSITTAVNWFIGRAGFELRRAPAMPNDPPPHSDNLPPLFMDEPQWIREIVDKVSPFTMTSPERIISLCHAVQYVSQHGIAGDVVECGVWRGGSMMAAALTFAHLGDTTRSLYLFDTFEGMTSPTDVDRHIGSRRPASDMLSKEPKTGRVWAISPIDEVRTNVQQTGYPDARLHFIKGRVEDTIPASAPVQICLLRLDTDWYESTHHELSHLYPRLSEYGVLIIDDYGWWEGARKAVDEYVEANKLPLLLHRIDNSGGRIAIKPSSFANANEHRSLGEGGKVIC
jgi:O-methyltransferase